MRTLLLFCILGVLSLGIKAQTNIAAARAAALYSTVNIRGVVINGPEMGVIRYIQDNTAGIAAYSSSLSTLNRGDSVIISGPLTEYKNLFEVATTTLNPAPVTFTLIGPGTLPAPQVITPANFNESVEGELVKFIGCTFSAAGTFSSGTNYTVNTSSGTLVARVTSSVSNLFGSAIPTGTVDIVGIGSQFCSSPASGCTTGYQLALRDLNDITNSTIGIKESSLASQPISVYPNPANSKISFNINNEAVNSVTVTDNLGRAIISSKENSDHLDVSKLSNGVYFIVITTDKHIYNSKFTIEK